MQKMQEHDLTFGIETILPITKSTVEQIIYLFAYIFCVAEEKGPLKTRNKPAKLARPSSRILQESKFKDSKFDKPESFINRNN